MYAPVYENGMSQTTLRPMFSVDNVFNDDTGMHVYTGLESYAMFVLCTLVPAAVWNIFISKLTVCQWKTIFVWHLWNWGDTQQHELARFCSVCESTVENIVHTWIIFMSKQWRKVNIWPSKELVKYLLPPDFKAKFPTTRVIVDGTECPFKHQKHPEHNKLPAHHKIKNTVKILDRSTPGGLVRYVSEAYGGCTSDRQIVELARLLDYVIRVTVWWQIRDLTCKIYLPEWMLQ